MKIFKDIVFSAIFVLCMFFSLVDAKGQVTHYVGIENATTIQSHTWASDNYSLTAETHYKLVSDVEVTNAFNLRSGVAVIDLNGHKLKLHSAGYSLFNVYGGELYIKDDTGKGEIIGIDGTVEGQENAYSQNAAIYVNATLNFVSGTIRDFKRASGPDSNAELGCAIFVDYNGIVNMKGGTITNCGFDLKRHHVGENTGNALYKDNILHRGGAVYIAAGGTFNFSGGTISNCTAYRGGGVFLGAPNIEGDVDNGKGLIMSGTAKIENCTASHRGGGVFVDAYNSMTGGHNRFVMNGGSIVGCRTRSAGCGVFSKGYVEINGGNIQGNLPILDFLKSGAIPDYSQQTILASVNPLGGGVCTEGRNFDSNNETIKGAVLIVKGGKIENNIGSSGGGIMAYNNSSLTIDGDVNIEGNHAIGNEGTGNGGGVYVQSSDFNFANGTISGNYARRYGGGINLNANEGTETVVNLSGNCSITDNYAGHGGGISQEAGVCKMSITSGNVNIAKNTARGISQVNESIGAYGDFGSGGNGGGIFIEKGELNISAGNISNNSAGGDGGGISLRGKRVNGTIMLNITGGSISGNNSNQTKYGNGGGIDIYAEHQENEDGSLKSKIDITAYIKGGTISNNYSSDGAGINIYASSKCTADLYIGEESGTLQPKIISNKASADGGAVTLENGTIKMIKGAIEGNSAKNGGAICLKNGSITVMGDDSYIRNNTAAEFGGGLYVVNESDTGPTVTFTGGTFNGNKAQNGGGICVHGNIALTANGTTLKSNSADNGGGIYLSGGGEMTYCGGLITGNVAFGTPDNATTAYGDGVDNVNKGVGGGVYLAANTSLNFKMDHDTPFGLYGNTAGFAADDIYANGMNTSLVLPDVSEMELHGFDVPTSELYWVEDYVQGDTEYSKGTGKGGSLSVDDVLRYKYALRNLKDIYKVDAGQYDKTYVCLALGYDLYHVTLVKKGLKVGESALFDVSYKSSDSDWVKYRTVLFSCVNDSQVGDAGVKSVVVLPAGTWKFEENSNWSWKYSLSDKVYNWKNEEITDWGSGILINSETFSELKSNDASFKYIFTNTPKEISGNLPSDEGVVVNILPN